MERRPLRTASMLIALAFGLCVTLSLCSLLVEMWGAAAWFIAVPPNALLLWLFSRDLQRVGSR